LLKDFIKPVSSLEALINGKDIEKLNILSLSGEERLEIESKISDVAFASSFPIIKGVSGNLEMTNTDATKGFAVKGLCDALGLSNENVMCFGDGENDCPMLEYADYSFAMANGNDLAKSTAQFVTDTNDNFGVAKAINKYVFGE
jgi:hydroxymethylpyrimidine pyrophosphatase-like HAD family hydrolase